MLRNDLLLAPGSVANKARPEHTLHSRRHQHGQNDIGYIQKTDQEIKLIPQNAAIHCKYPTASEIKRKIPALLHTI
jgi:hypothetical protein